jgi:hypothetical protein
MSVVLFNRNLETHRIVQEIIKLKKGTVLRLKIPVVYVRNGDFNKNYVYFFYSDHTKIG